MLNTKRTQTGASMVELMIGVTIGLVILSGATAFFGNYISSNRSLLLSTRLNQELRTATDLIARDLRRAGYWQNALDGIWYAASPLSVNAYTGIGVTTSGGLTINYRYALDNDDTVSASEETGFRLRDNTLQMLRNGAWVDLTDPNTTVVTAFTLTPAARTVQIPCINLCAGGGTACWPTLTVREYTIFIRAEARGDSGIRREMSEAVRVRNDLLTTANPICPA